MNKKLLFLLLSLICFSLVGCGDKSTQNGELETIESYSDVIELLSTGNCEEAYKRLMTYDNTEPRRVLENQIYFESIAYECINRVYDVSVNPDSLQVMDVRFYNGEKAEEQFYKGENLADFEDKILEATFDEKLICVIDYIAEVESGDNVRFEFTLVNENGEYLPRGRNLKYSSDSKKLSYTEQVVTGNIGIAEILTFNYKEFEADYSIKRITKVVDNKDFIGTKMVNVIK